MMDARIVQRESQILIDSLFASSFLRPVAHFLQGQLKHNAQQTAASKNTAKSCMINAEIGTPTASGSPWSVLDPGYGALTR